MPLFYSASRETLAQQQFDRLGHPGKFYSVIEVKGTAQVDFTGSNYGYGAVMISGSNIHTPAARIALSGGGEITSSVLAGLGIVEMSPLKVYGGSVRDCIYVFKKRGL